ncbi:MAG TPA: hypothetical protein VF943_01080 [Burkholderiales bacterium]
MRLLTLRGDTPRPLALDYAAPLQRRRWPGAAALAIALAIAAALVIRYGEVQQERAALLARLDLQQAGTRAVRALPARAAGDEAKSIEVVTRQLALPWPEMIESVESAANRQVALLVLQPEPERGTLRLTAEAGTPQAMLDYVRRLGESEALAGAHLVSHQVRRESAARPIQFVAQATLRGRK